MLSELNNTWGLVLIILCLWKRTVTSYNMLLKTVKEAEYEL